jgi:hypothetical protein
MNDVAPQQQRSCMLRQACRALRPCAKMTTSAPSNPLIAVIGATGTGKSQVNGHCRYLPIFSDLSFHVLQVGPGADERSEFRCLSS